MAENQGKEGPKKPNATAGKKGFEQMFPVNFAQIQARNMATAARANEILVRTAKAMWEKETELFKPGNRTVAQHAGADHAGRQSDGGLLRLLGSLACPCREEHREYAGAQ